MGPIHAAGWYEAALSAAWWWPSVQPLLLPQQPWLHTQCGGGLWPNHFCSRNSLGYTHSVVVLLMGAQGLSLLLQSLLLARLRRERWTALAAAAWHAGHSCMPSLTHGVPRCSLHGACSLHGCMQLTWHPDTEGASLQLHGVCSSCLLPAAAQIMCALCAHRRRG